MLQRVVGSMLLVTSLVTLMIATGCRSARYYYKAAEGEDFLIGALFPIHQPPYTKQHMSRNCGAFWERPGIQRMEAALQAVDDINSRRDLLPNTTLGIQIRDNCWYAAISLEQVSQLIGRSAWSKIEYQEVSHPYRRPPDAGDGAQCEDRGPDKNLVAVVGSLLEGGADDVHSLLSLFRIPLVSYAFAGQEPELSSLLGYFVSVAPWSEPVMARAMADLVTYFNWTYVSTVFTSDASNEAALTKFMAVSKIQGVCIAQFLALSAGASDQEYREAVDNLRKVESGRVVVCFCTSVTVAGLFTAIRDSNSTGRFTLVVSDAWMANKNLLQGLEEQAAGSLTFRIHVEPDKEFEAYYTSLNPTTNIRNPWFRPFWESRFQCSLGSQNDAVSKSVENCTGDESLSDGYEQDPLIEGVQSAIYMVARALHDMLRDYCQGRGDRKCYRRIHVTGDQFLEYLINASAVYRRSIPELGKERSVTPWYDVMNFVKSEISGLEIVPVATWSNSQLTILKSPEWDAQGSTEVPSSDCGRPCSAGHVKVHQSLMNVCCWKCVQCAENQYVADEYLCAQCGQGTWPNESLDGCDPIPQKYTQWSEAGSIVAMVMSALSVTSTLCTTAIFVRHVRVPELKASSLSFVLLVGVLASEAGTFAVVSKPSVASCLLERVCPVLGVATVYAAILAKTYGLCRIRKDSETSVFPRMASPVSPSTQLAITGGLAAVQFVITAAMLVFQRPGTIQVYPEPNHSVLLCNTTDLAFFLPWSYNFLLIILCTLFAFSARKLSARFNEAKMIGFAMYSSVVIWIAYVAVYVGNENNRKLSLCLAISASSQVLVALLFLPRIYAVLSEPMKNACCALFGFRAKAVAASTVSIVQECGRRGSQSARGSLESVAHDKAK
ncbi:metabotropic glutamate receptor 5-like isoform X2 [Amblyomma americanum]